MAANPSSTSVATISATSVGVPLESTRPQILTLDEPLDKSTSSFQEWSMLKRLQPCLAAMALRMAISKPHLTLGKSEDGCTIGKEINRKELH